MRKTLAEVDQEGELLPDGTLSVYVAFILEKLTSATGLWLNYILFLPVEKYNFLALAGMDKQLRSFTSGLAIHRLTILQNQ